MFKGFKLSRFPKISSQILIYFAYVVLILANSLWFFPSLSKVRQEAAILQMEMAKRAEGEISNFINGHLGELERISGSVAVSPNREFLLSPLLKDQDIQQVVVIDETGKEIFKSHRYRKIYPEELRNRSNEGGFKQVFLEGKNYISPIFTENLEPMIDIVVPLRASQIKNVGTLEVTLNLKSLWSKVGSLQIGEEGVVYVVNTNGMIVAHKDPTVVLSGTYVLDKEIIRKLIIEGKEVDGLGSESQYLDINNQEVFGVGIPIKSLGWAVVVEQPEKDAFAGRNRLLQLGGAALGLGIVLLFALQMVIARLAKTALLLEKEKQKAEEWSQVLGVRVKAATQELRELTESLEKKVEERTQELAQRYKQLEFQKNELDKTAKILIARDLALSETKDWLSEALTKSDKARLEAAEAKKALEEKLKELESFHKLAVGRELKMMELKKEIEKLKKELEKYSSEESN